MVIQNQSELGEGSAIPTDPHHTPTILQPSLSQPQKTQKPKNPTRKDNKVPQLSGPTDNVANEDVHKELVMSDASSAVSYTSVYTDSEPWRYYGEDSAKTGPPRVNVYGYDGLPIQLVAPPSPDYVPGPEHPPSPDYVPGLEHPPSPAEADYPTNRGDGDDEPSDDDDDDDTNDKVPEEPFEEDDEEEEEHLASADSSVVPIVDLVLPTGETEALKRACLTTLVLGFEIRESSAAGATRQPGPTESDLRRCGVEHAGYGITNTQRTDEFNIRFEEAQDDRALLRARVNTLFRDRPDHGRTAMHMDREAMYARKVWAFSMDRSSAIAAHVRTLETQVAALITQIMSLQTQLTTALGRIEGLEARDPEPQEGPVEAGSIYEVIHKELGDRLVRAATTASSLAAKQDSGNITKTQSKETPNEPSSQGTNSGGDPRGNTLQSDEDRMKLDELMALCTSLQNMVLYLEKTKTTQNNEIASLKRRPKKLKKNNRSKTHKMKRLYKVALTAMVESYGDEESLSEDAFKLEGGLMLFMHIKTLPVSTAATTITITTEEITLAQALEALKTSKPKVKGIVFQEPDEEEVVIDAIPLAVKEDLEDLYKLVKTRYGSTRPVESMDYLLWSDMKTIFKPHVEDEIWKMQQGYKVLEWKIYDSYGVHPLMMQSMQIFMLVEKKYPLTPPTLSMTVEKKIQIDYENADHAGCLDTRKSTSGGTQFLGEKLVCWSSNKQDYTTISIVEAEYVSLSSTCVGIKGLLDVFGTTAAQGYVNTALMKLGNVVGARETVGSTVVQKSGIQCYNCKEFRHVARECYKPEICEHPEQSESIHDTYPIEQDEHNVVIDSLDMSYDREQIDQNDDDNDLANKRELLASLIEKLKCKIDDNKNRNKFLETSNKKIYVHQETISILSQQKEAQIKLYKTREDKELDKVIALKNKVKVLDNIVYKTSQSVQTMNMLNNKCQTSFTKPEFLKKAQRENPRLAFKESNDVKSFEALQKHAINLEIDLQQCQEKDLKAQLQDKGIVINELKKLIEKLKGKSVDTKFEKSSVIRQPNAFKSQRPSILGKPTIFSDSLERKDFSKSKSVTKNNGSNDFSKPVTAQILPLNKKSILKNTNVLAPGMYKLHTEATQTRTSQLPQYFRKTNKRVSFSTGVIPITRVSRPQLKSNPMEDRVMLKNSQGKKQEVEDHRRNVKFSKNKMSVTACNDSLNAKTVNVNFVCASCGKCVLNEKYNMCVLKSINNVNSRTKMPIVVPLVEIVLFIVDFGCSKHMTGNLKLLINFMEKFLGTVKFRNDQIAPISCYGDLKSFPPLDNPELTIRRRSRSDLTLLNNSEMAAEGPGDQPVPGLQTMAELCQPSLNGQGGPIAPISIQAMLVL
nr:ribonuclease H-like domain-containing protein [Tanacetum cinerariifolium]